MTNRCEDYPCCGHTDGDGCAPLASHSAEFYFANPQLLHEPGSPEWYDAQEEVESDDCPWCAGDEDDEPNTDLLCLNHEAEYEGLSVNELQRRDREQHAEWADAAYG